MKKKIAQSIVERIREPVEKILSAAQEAADRQLPALQARAVAALEEDLGAELQRLQALRAVNATIREDEIEALRGRIGACRAHIERARFQLQALRVIVNS